MLTFGDDRLERRMVTESSVPAFVDRHLTGVLVRLSGVF